jgi:uncharacterized protein YbaR (Trm112 family)
MFIELVDALRCPVPHEESWLVASALRMQDRHILDGALGCPICHAEYPIVSGVVDFRRAAPRVLPAGTEPDAEQAMRLAAFLSLSDATGFAVLLGAWGAHAPELIAQVDTPLVLVDPPADVMAQPRVSIIRSDGELPLAVGAARGVAIDADAATDAARLASAVRALRVKGRIIAPATAEVPEGIRELARDDTLWVGEREAGHSGLVTLHVRRGSPSGAAPTL